VLIGVGLARAEPGIPLDGIAHRLQDMGQRALFGDLRWSRSSVRDLLDRATEPGQFSHVRCGHFKSCDEPTQAQ
jgi:hypothetical protein